jgi:hypothetical protein
MFTKPLTHIQSVLFAAALLIASVGASAQTNKEIHKLRANVIEVEQLRQFKGPAQRTLTPDPRFVLTVRIESIAPPLAVYTNGNTMSFAIHSPALIGLDGASKGQTYDFVVSREVHGETKGPWWFELPAVRVRPGGAANGSQSIRSGTNQTPSAVGSHR